MQLVFKDPWKKWKQNKEYYSWKLYQLDHFNPIQNGGREKGPPASFPPLSSTNLDISPQNFLTFCFNPSATVM